MLISIVGFSQQVWRFDATNQASVEKSETIPSNWMVKDNTFLITDTYIQATFNPGSSFKWTIESFKVDGKAIMYKTKCPSGVNSFVLVNQDEVGNTHIVMQRSGDDFSLWFYVPYTNIHRLK